MTIVLRLQGLDVKAGPEDIRTFFYSLNIPDGGVYIVGGHLREAFIAFKTERDAQLAMRYNGNYLKGSQVTLHISSTAELEHKLKSFLKKKKSSKLIAKKHHPEASATSLNVRPPNDSTANLSPPAAMPPDRESANLPHANAQHADPSTESMQTSSTQSVDSGTAFLLGMYTILKGLQPSHQTHVNDAAPLAAFSEAPDEVGTPGETVISRPGYVRLFGLSASATKADICCFFKGLAVQEAIVNVKLGVRPCCLVKFANKQDACDALLFNQQSVGSICVEVRQATEKMWAAALKDCERAGQKNHLTKSVNFKKQSFAPQHLKRPSRSQLPSKPSKKPKPNADLNTPISPTKDYTVMVNNMPTNMTKTELKEFFRCPNLPHKNVLHLLDTQGNRTDTAFLIFDGSEDYHYALNLTGSHMGSDPIKVSSISKEEMREKMAIRDPRRLKHCLNSNRKKKPNQIKLGPTETVVVPTNPHQHPAKQACLFVRNMPANVQKSQIKCLFSTYKVKLDDIVLLCDSEGNGIGEAVVRFKSEKLAALAERIHGTTFMGNKVLLTRINVKQMEDIVARSV